jgi:hypothetical protein
MYLQTDIVITNFRCQKIYSTRVRRNSRCHEKTADDFIKIIKIPPLSTYGYQHWYFMASPLRRNPFISCP